MPDLDTLAWIGGVVVVVEVVAMAALALLGHRLGARPRDRRDGEL